MRFTVDFKCDNDAFKPEERPEIINCLHRIIELLNHPGRQNLPDDLYQNVLDSNGNIVGTFRISTRGIFA